MDRLVGALSESAALPSTRTLEERLCWFTGFDLRQWHSQISDPRPEVTGVKLRPCDRVANLSKGQSEGDAALSS